MDARLSMLGSGWEVRKWRLSYKLGCGRKVYCVVKVRGKGWIEGGFFFFFKEEA